jgi:hypothetical protein
MYDKTNVNQLMEAERLRWLNRLSGTNKTKPYKKLTLINVEGTRRVGDISMRWLDNAEQELRTVRIGSRQKKRPWKRTSGEISLKRSGLAVGCSSTLDDDYVKIILFQFMDGLIHLVGCKYFCFYIL